MPPERAGHQGPKGPGARQVSVGCPGQRYSQGPGLLSFPSLPSPSLSLYLSELGWQQTRRNHLGMKNRGILSLTCSNDKQAESKGQSRGGNGVTNTK